jgi:hypothetical protein
MRSRRQQQLSGPLLPMAATTRLAQLRHAGVGVPRPLPASTRLAPGCSDNLACTAAA